MNENEITLTIDLTPFLTGDDDSIAGLLIREAGRQLAQQVTYERAPEVREQAAALIEDMLRDRLAPQVEKVLEAGIRKSAYGEPVPLPEFIADTVTAQLKINEHARFDSERTLLDRLIRKEIQRTVAHDLRETMAAAKRQVQEAVEAEGAKLIRETIERLAAGKGVMPQA